jgi:hypothetical protein
MYLICVLAVVVGSVFLAGLSDQHFLGHKVGQPLVNVIQRFSSVTDEKARAFVTCSLFRKV